MSVSTSLSNTSLVLLGLARNTSTSHLLALLEELGTHFKHLLVFCKKKQNKQMTHTYTQSKHKSTHISSSIGLFKQVHSSNSSRSGLLQTKQKSKQKGTPKKKQKVPSLT